MNEQQEQKRGFSGHQHRFRKNFETFRGYTILGSTIVNQYAESRPIGLGLPYENLPRELGLIPLGNTVPNQRGDRVMSAATTSVNLADVVRNDLHLSPPPLRATLQLKRKNQRDASGTSIKPPGYVRVTLLDPEIKYKSLPTTSASIWEYSPSPRTVFPHTKLYFLRQSAICISRIFGVRLHLKKC